HPQRDLAKRQMAAGGTIVAVELAGGLAAATTFCESTRVARMALSLGGPETLVVHPASTVGRQLTPAERAELGISDGLVRISVGLGPGAGLIADVGQALARAEAAGAG